MPAASVPAAASPAPATTAAPPTASTAAPAQNASTPAVAASPVPAPILDATVAVAVRADGRRIVDVQSAGGLLRSDAEDTFLVHGLPDDRFVFDPGFRLDVVQQFRATGADHDVLDLPPADFAGGADVLRHTWKAPGGIAITDPASGDRLRLTGINKGQLARNPADIAVHG